MYANPNARGFSLVELVIVVVIVGLLAAIAIPRFSRGAAGATDSALSGDLAVLRNAIEMYGAEHNGTYPLAATFEAQLTQYTKLDGSTSATKDADFPYGPYLHAVPALKVGAAAGGTGIKAVTAAPTLEDADTSVGWLYNQTTGQIYANDTTNIAR
ncbi:prepilin-type N-terminal cleavage/methylation domain-containing protein [Algisphaera agarilytica]|uniref:General secretion pathway protein G n=1 Tax=Algisphaera agarilytica TaxID=1385975 RepID=A0A7X0LK45_9BACT|nr:prepilin-type N-terminal cleavage/methylation domain-containing protein [Algisphaera agarilytica]MBB6429256.1 general secretion pathway protein G [Algisphaera agarilytica]